MHLPDQESRGHISPMKTYLTTFAGLLVLTGVTFGASLFNFGEHLGGGFIVNVIIAVIIATAKAYLVLWNFMHMKYEDKFVWMYGILYPLVLFALLLGFASIDVFLRVIPRVP